MDRQGKILAVIVVVVLAVAGFVIYNNHHQTGNHITYSQTAEYAYVASSERDIYHRPTCRWAQKISAANLVGYNTREEAEKSGRRPCKVCKP
jgi:cbb3-type cytochrome oxidase cytochrome c subunit